jgi:signal transduction histidine kinase
VFGTDASHDFDLFNTFAHDLKTPLAAAKSFIDLMEHSGELNERQRVLLNRSLMALGRMENIINELLDYARLGAEKALHITDCPLATLIEDAVLLLEELARRRHISLHVDLPADLSPVQGDARMLSHVFTNLLSNAIKYNREGGAVYVSARPEGTQIVVEVRDTGIGIDAKDLPHIFDHFYRVKRRGGDSIEGSGLGLAIVKAVLERHGGDISVSSTPGEGSRFLCRLPRSTAAAAGDDRFSRPAPESQFASRPVVFHPPGPAAGEINDAMDDNLQESDELRDPDSSHDGR